MVKLFLYTTLILNIKSGNIDSKPKQNKATNTQYKNQINKNDLEFKKINNILKQIYKNKNNFQIKDFSLKIINLINIVKVYIEIINKEMKNNSSNFLNELKNEEEIFYDSIKRIFNSKLQNNLYIFIELSIYITEHIEKLNKIDCSCSEYHQFLKEYYIQEINNFIININ